MVNGKKILTTSTIYINQIIEGINRQRSVIIQTPTNINLSKDYPIVFALHGGSRDAEGIRNSMIQKSIDFNFVIIAPKFSSSNFSLNLFIKPSFASFFS